MIDNIKNHWAVNIDHCIVAGGFFRDNFIGRSVKDIDLFCTLDNEDSLLRLLSMRIAEEIKVKNDKWTRRTPEEQEEIASKYNLNHELTIKHVRCFRTYQGELIDVIVGDGCTETENILKSFDYTVNAIAYDNISKEFDVHPWTLIDLLNMRLRVINLDNIREGRQEYMEAMGFSYEG